MSFFRKWFGKARKTAQELAEDANTVLVQAADRITQILEDVDGNGLPDIAEKVAGQAARIVEALELIQGHASGSGATKLNRAMIEILAASRKGAATWELVRPFIEAAVTLLPRKR